MIENNHPSSASGSSITGIRLWIGFRLTVGCKVGCRKAEVVPYQVQGIRRNRAIDCTSHNIDFATYSRTGVLESIGLSLTSQYHRQALTGIFEWNGQTFPPLRPPAYLLVRLVDEVNSGRIWESNDGGVAVYGGVVPGVYRAGKASTPSRWK